jgi:hypothetical protein
VNRHKPHVQTLDVSSYSTLALIDDFVLLFLPPWGPHLTPPATGSLESGLLVSPLLGGPQGIDLSRPLFTCTNANHAATYTCNTRPRVSPHHVVNHSSQPGPTIHRSGRFGPQVSVYFVTCSCTFEVWSVGKVGMCCKGFADHPPACLGPTTRYRLPTDHPRVGYGTYEF